MSSTRKAGAVGLAVTAGASAGLLLRNSDRRVHLERRVRVLRLTARRGLRWAEFRIRGRAADDAKRAELEERFVIQSAEDVAQVLGNMKGAIMKAGQMFSFIADGLPPEAAAALATLQSDVAPMAPHLAEGVIIEELGKLPEDLFLDWDPVPVAAASVGQVHKAVLRDGREVAVKVQYPGVDTAINSDLDNAQLLYTMFSQFALPSLDVKALVDEVRERMADELDYRLEAKSQQQFADYYRDHPFISIPAVVHEFSARRVLTTEWVDGMKWQDFLDTAPAASKQKAAEVLLRFGLGSVFDLHMFNGDPHPGNYKFHRDGSITFLDFGLVKRWKDDELDELTPVLDAVLHQDASMLIKQMERLHCIPTDHHVSPDQALDYATTPYVPFISGDFRYTRDFVREAITKIMDFDGKYKELLSELNLPTSYVIFDRLVWGLGALFGRLDASANWGALLAEYYPGTEPTTELGRLEQQWRVDTNAAARNPSLTH